MNNNDIHEISRKLKDNLKKKGYDEISEHIEGYIKWYEKQYFEEQHLLLYDKEKSKINSKKESYGQMSFDMNQVENNMITKEAKELFTKTVGVIYFYFIEQKRIVSEIQNFFSSEFEISEGKVRLEVMSPDILKKDWMDTQAIQVFEKKYKLEDSGKTILRDIIRIGEDYKLFIDNNLMEKIKNEKIIRG
ncbi:hypothetical protein P4U05_10790 [Bacillus paranthracis]|uniref:hypothetical protein n=1 Tax=Bacillus paranthracis TaxID=2026186 RepID=UPI000200F27A|nr:hypothetical protein [Bacillus paranthracis]ADY19762.1 hypothetical protein YBT020_02560 [Bacillus thuringiensis serovar finitimus YBT-020]MRC71321.1 hypothetical protein [Bacillus thuringiensis]OTX74470.1 hypothetical protein BK722_07375 [Bacillus thuringiensis serovar finitimus]MCR6799940.1 hypothetical protein [Bacillus paranthracis]MEC3359286.1 hypothetical protein [Bacillus paranthracis]